MAEVTADSLFKEFRKVPLSEFFRKNKQYLGYVGKIKSMTTIIHELVTNALDACEESGIQPNLKVHIQELGSEHYKVTVEDNGPGIPATHMKDVFGSLLAGTKFHRNIQLRGQQGLGVSGAVLFSQITTGKPTRVKSGTGNGKVIDATIQIDIKSNMPQIVSQEELFDSWRGTIVEAEFKGIQYSKGLQGPFEYIRRTAAANPHMEIFFKDPEDNEILFEKVVDKVPKRPEEQKPHPEGLETHDILDLATKSKARAISGFLTKDLSRISSQKVRELEAIINKTKLEANREKITDLLVKEAFIPQENISDMFKRMDELANTEKINGYLKGIFEERGVPADRMKQVTFAIDKQLYDMRMSPKRMEWGTAEALVEAFKQIQFMAPPTSGLIPIGKSQIESALTGLLTPDFCEALTRNPTVFRGGIPFLIEVAVCYGGNAGRQTAEGSRSELMRFANRAPLLFDSGSCCITKAVQSIEWKRYHIQDYENAPISVFVNIVSTHVPYTSTGKQAVANEEEVYNEIRFALMQVARSLQSFLSGKRRALEMEAKKKMFERYVPETAKALSKITQADAKEIEIKLAKIVEDKFGEEMAAAEESGEPSASYEEGAPAEAEMVEEEETPPEEAEEEAMPEEAPPAEETEPGEEAPPEEVTE
jgi:DNA topoisomerase-6 subunit B